MRWSVERRKKRRKREHEKGKTMRKTIMREEGKDSMQNEGGRGK